MLTVRSRLSGLWHVGPIDGRRLLLAGAVTAMALAAATAAITVLEGPFEVPNASPVYLIAVVAVAIGFGTTAGVLAGVLSFLLYDVLFIKPLYTFTVADPREWINLVLFLLVAIVIGRLTALQAERAVEADRRARESQALFAISRTLATASSAAAAAPVVMARLAEDSGMSRIWFATGTGSTERVVVDSIPDKLRPRPNVHWMLVRTPGEQPARWMRTHTGGEPGRTSAPATESLFRVKVEAEGSVVGSLWATRPAASGIPNREGTRLLALAADQLGLALRRDELNAAATAAEVARQSDALKSALLTSVSHDLRTPLSSIRAAAGSLMDPALTWSPEDQRAIGRAIDVEADRLNRLVRNLLDLSRIEGGALKPDLHVFDLDELLEPVIERVAPLLANCRLELALPHDVPPVHVDAVYLDEAVTNLLENAAKYAGKDARIRISAGGTGSGGVQLTIEDSGPGVPPSALPHLFEKFYRVPRDLEGSRKGMGIGLSVVKGLVEAMGGTVSARASALGGLAVDLRVPAASMPLTEPAA